MTETKGNSFKHFRGLGCLGTGGHADVGCESTQARIGRSAFSPHRHHTKRQHRCASRLRSDSFTLVLHGLPLSPPRRYGFWGSWVRSRDCGGWREVLEEGRWRSSGACVTLSAHIVRFRASEQGLVLMPPSLNDSSFNSALSLILCRPQLTLLQPVGPEYQIRAARFKVQTFKVQPSHGLP